MIAFSFKEIVDELPIGELINTDESPFWYHTQYDGAADKKYRYHHETGKVRDIFYDGNNGDKWIVRAINTSHKRILVENLTQCGFRLAYWE
jgi:hypothetical protein